MIRILLKPDERDLRVELRMARREALSPPRQITAYLTEHVLHGNLGGPEVMTEQLRHLLEIASRANVDVRVIPDGQREWTLAHEGAFVLYRFPKAAPIVHLEHYRGPAFLYDNEDVRSYERALDTLPDTAMSSDQSIELMTRVAEKLEGTTP
ncbi:DUF5753 domain-containing protein [Actinopolyspora saharensis]|uniref:DUF5753 domain-containing protein n=1 Tax=Actinopolyspora saharensis TaxID=995062 RepID=UPI003F6686B4